jgi:hypothetical protein
MKTGAGETAPVFSFAPYVSGIGKNFRFGKSYLTDGGNVQIKYNVINSLKS